MPLPNIGKIFSKLKFLQLPINIRSTLVKMIGIIKTETLNKLVQLERKIDQQINLKGTTTISKEDYVVKADKLVEKALKNGKKGIRLPGADNPEVKKLQDVLNKELKYRRNLPSGNPKN